MSADFYTMNILKMQAIDDRAFSINEIIRLHMIPRGYCDDDLEEFLQWNPKTQYGVTELVKELQALAMRRFYYIMRRYRIL